MAVTYSTCSPRFSTAGEFLIYAIIHLYLGLSPLSKVKHLIHYPGLGKVFFLNFRESFYFTFNSIPCLISFHIAFHFSFVKINHCVTSTCVRETFQTLGFFNLNNQETRAASRTLNLSSQKQSKQLCLNITVENIYRTNFEECIISKASR